MLKYWLWLATRPGLSPWAANLVLAHFRSPREAYHADRSAYEMIPRLRTVKPLLDKDMSGPEEILRVCRQKRIGILTQQDAAYPERLRTIDDAPLVLYYRGMLPELDGPSVAVVGTRKASSYGMQKANEIGLDLSACGFTVVSGGAKGIDAAALNGAMNGGNPVIAVLGCGVDVVYPAENRKLFDRILSAGCLISEYPPGTGPERYHFPARNRIISGLSLGVLVIEAPEKSGALVTVQHALDQSRDVFVLSPGEDSSGFSGNLKLLEDGAREFCSVEDMVREYWSEYPNHITLNPVAPKQPVQKAVQTTTVSPVLKECMDKLSGDEKTVAEILKSGELYVDLIVEAAKLPVGKVLAALTMLEVKKIVRRVGDRRYALVSESD